MNKNIKNVITIALTSIILLSVLTSCSNSVMKIYGPPGTIINGRWEIGQSGYIDHRIYGRIINDSYLLTARLPGSDVTIPFALDYKKGYRTRNTIFMITGLGFFLPQGIVGSVDETSFPGTYNMTFDKKIILPNEVNIPSPWFNEYKPEITSTSKSDITEADNISLDRKETNNTSLSSKRINNWANKIVGDYICHGTLCLNSETMEDYQKITISIKKTDNNNIVGVNIIEPDGTKFFESDEPYNISKTKDGCFTLTHERIQNAVITIDINGKISYYHPAIEIEEELYQLKLETL